MRLFKCWFEFCPHFLPNDSWLVLKAGHLFSHCTSLVSVAHLFGDAGSVTTKKNHIPHSLFFF